MGICVSGSKIEQSIRAQRVAQDRRAKRIDATISRDRADRHSQIKLLLLGTGECGKTTILKQMKLAFYERKLFLFDSSKTTFHKILHHKGFSEAEMAQQRRAIFTSTLAAMGQLVTAMPLMGVELEHSRNRKHKNLILEELLQCPDRDRFTDQMYIALKCLWADSGVREVYRRRATLHLPDTAKYFLDSLDRLHRLDYTPSEQDMLCSRIRTTGVVEVAFFIKGITFRVIDVGGQRTERRKWIHSFEGVDAIIYISAINEFDQGISEDSSTNGLQESMMLFDVIANNMWFTKTDMILFLNKTDLFAEKIKETSLSDCFPAYTGPNTYESTIGFIEERFEQSNQNRRRSIYRHRTCATDTRQVQQVLDSVTNVIIDRNARRAKLY